MGKCSCGISQKMPKCDGTCKKLKKDKKKEKKSKKEKLKDLKKLCGSLLLYIFMREK